MKKIIIFAICIVAIFSIAYAAGTAIVEWDAPTTWQDGSPLNPDVDIAEYRLYRSNRSGTYSTFVSIPGTTRIYTVSSLPTGTHYFVLTAVSTAVHGSMESAYSNEATKYISPVAPGTCTIRIR